jgi:hypothetical protein
MKDKRAQRWVTRGAIILALLSAFFGLLFNSFMTVVLNEVPAEGAVLHWLRVISITVAAWGTGGAIFGAILGAFASMIWRPGD